MARRKERFADKPQKEYDEVMLEVRRVTRVTTGGRQLSFRAIILVGNRKGSIGIGIAKGSDVQIAVAKATHDAYKHLVTTPINEAGTVPYQVTNKYKAAVVKLIPAAAGTGLKAGSSVRMVLELAGYTNILSKIVGSQNKLNNARATVNALGNYKQEKFPERIKKAPVIEEKSEEIDSTPIEKSPKVVSPKIEEKTTDTKKKAIASRPKKDTENKKAKPPLTTSKKSTKPVKKETPSNKKPTKTEPKASKKKTK